ncbi:uncharacterized protein LOC141587198 [Silene latifolia]|uniref:uncharacterized protein LOC141587198 n=1 Tax=Silene latifolia TaxID=37657 RepID=UPI003D774F29
MEAQISTSELAITTKNCTEKAWHLAAVLMSIGRPSSPAELAEKCSLFPASIVLVKFLCFIPNSPLFLTKNDLVLLSASAFRVVGEFFALSAPRIQIGVFDAAMSFNRFSGGDVVRTYFRKRKNFGSEVVPLVKKRAIMRSAEGNDRENESFNSKCKTIVDIKARPLDIPERVALENFSDNAAAPSIPISDTGLLKYHSKNDDYEEYESKLNTPQEDDFFLVEKRAHFRSVEGNEREKEKFGANNGPILALKALPLDDMSRGVALGNFSDKAVTRSMTFSNTEFLKSQSKNDDYQGCENKLKASQEDLENYLVMGRPQDKNYTDNATSLNTLEVRGEGCGPLIFKSLAEISAFLGVDEPDPVDLKAKMDVDASSCLNLDQYDKDVSLNAAVAFHAHKDVINRQAPETKNEDTVELALEKCVTPDGRPEKEKHSYGSCGLGSLFEDILCTTMESPTSKQPTLPEEIANNKACNQALVTATLQSGNQKTFSRLSAVQKKVPELKPTLKQKAPLKLQQGSKVDIFCKKTRAPKDQNATALKDNGKHIARDIAAVEQKCANKSVKDLQKSNYPEFESYTVEEEEGSGGYGTVYRARRKTDGVTFAIKCPHANAHVHHLKNELKMLQRFGGKNFVIKYEGSLKSGNDDCFVLEHVEHDRPEALKREIDINQLQWYGFCLFKALTSLHKQGVFHRDVKPGNFLFSCKTKNGYLIDFNLAKDLHQKPGSLDKSQPGHMSASEHVPALQHTFATSSKRRKILSGKPSVALNPGAINGTSHTQESKTLKSKTMGRSKVFDDLGRGNSLASQGADASGLTSKDLTSTRTSGERLREPIPCQGRKELINLAQKAMQIPNPGTGSAPISKRKRIVASPIVMDQKFIYPTPAPLHSFGSNVFGAGSLNNKGDSKAHKEGPCVGTKGFRAPEVLLRSPYQGPKIDVWSAGVTLLYLITGKMPFTGDPEQNMKDIVKLKGNEELWEVAKLHNRDSSIPVELLDVKFLRSMTIKEWCVANTKRTRFLDAIPSSLFDLIEKCLIVNPRLRITAEEAFRHDFFAPCHDTLQRIKLRKMSQDRQPRSNSLPMFHESVGTPNSSQLRL